jgi:signal transduction histidine kinase
MLSQDIFKVTTLLARGSNAFVNGDFKRLHGNIVENLNALEKDVATLSINPSGSTIFAASHSELLGFIQRQRDLFFKAEQSEPTNSALIGRLKPLNIWLRICSRESELLKSELVLAHKSFEQEEQAQRKDQQFITVVVPLALLFNLFVAYFLAKWFHRDIALRLEQLVKVAKTLPLNKRFTKPLGGNDELSQFGSELSRVSCDLADATEMRQSLMQMMAHDVRSPLMAVDISIEMLEVSLTEHLSPGGVSQLTEAGGAISECLLLVNDLLLLEKLDNSGEQLILESHDINEVFCAAQRKVLNYAEQKSVEIVNEVASQVLMIDADLVSLVMQRMLLTAVQRTPIGTKVLCTGAQDTTDFRLSIRDQGALITNELGEKLFDKFYVAGRESDVPGFGLGLAVAKPIIELHGGAIGQGSSTKCNFIWLELPLRTLSSIS